MEEEFAKSVEDGLRLAKRVYTGKERHTTTPPRLPVGMESSPASLLPSAPMIYAVISDPAIVDNPDFPSYQPHVYGRCHPPALIPLQMKEIAMEVDSYLEMAFVSIQGRWRVHCVMGSRKCDCRLVLPMGEQGSILGVEVNVAKRSYSTKLIERDSDQSMEKFPKNENGGYLNSFLFSLTIPQVDGGCDISLSVRWSQKLLFKDGDFSISIPFNFPEFVTPLAKIIAKREKILLNVNTCNENEVIVKKASHALKEKCRQVGKLSVLYEADVENWSTKDFYFSYSVISRDFYGGILLAPSVHGSDQINMFCLYLYPVNHQKRKVFRKEVVFLVDISGSMEGKTLENVKNALFLVLSDLSPADYFNIIAFNEGTFTFSSYMEPAIDHKLEGAKHWTSKNFVAHGGTNIMQPLNEALALLSNTREDSVPYIFLVTDGAVENERAICHAFKAQIENRGPITPRICTFGIGTYCNHYFLQMLSSIGRGHYGAAYDQDSVESSIQSWFRRALFPLVTNITVPTFDDLDAFEVLPSNIPDLLVECPLIISGKYQGKFPDTVNVEGRLADASDIVISLKVQHMGNIPLERVFSKQQIDLLTAQAWFAESKQLEEKVAKLSLHCGIPSEYTHMVFLQTVAKMPENDRLLPPGSSSFASPELLLIYLRSTAFSCSIPLSICARQLLSLARPPPSQTEIIVSSPRPRPQNEIPSSPSAPRTSPSLFPLLLTEPLSPALNPSANFISPDLPHQSRSPIPCTEVRILPFAISKSELPDLAVIKFGQEFGDIEAKLGNVSVAMMKSETDRATELVVEFNLKSAKKFPPLKRVLIEKNLAVAIKSATRSVGTAPKTFSASATGFTATTPTVPLNKEKEILYEEVSVNAFAQPFFIFEIGFNSKFVRLTKTQEMRRNQKILRAKKVKATDLAGTDTALPTPNWMRQDYGFTIKTFEKLVSKVGNLQEEAKQLGFFEKTVKLESLKTSEKKSGTVAVHFSLTINLFLLIVKKGEKPKTESGADFIQTPTLLDNLTPGFGNPLATAENLPPGCRKSKQTQTLEVIEKAVGCCSGIFDCSCCVCCIKMCAKMNDQCAIALTQLCTALSCLACCSLCCDGSD
ncbi:uncharacterized protein LOC110029423 [Phalaenopsis equestris]|uniref:uncharacterized protein LOC110029423 n=1 Tax=Phalaenopsis equestris TaxID=78828 RepID=UPI0009E325D5|nr:uncharacterized protein LOC110029423 [Phalaenopsis equestris]